MIETAHIWSVYNTNADFLVAFPGILADFTPLVYFDGTYDLHWLRSCEGKEDWLFVKMVGDTGDYNNLSAWRWMSKTYIGEFHIET